MIQEPQSVRLIANNQPAQNEQKRQREKREEKSTAQKLNDKVKQKEQGQKSKVEKNIYRGFSNQFFAYYNAKQSNDIHVYLPAYLRIKIKTIKSIQLDQLQSQINLTLLLGIYYDGFDKQIQELIKTKFSIHFRRNNVLLLQEGKNSELNVKHEKQYANFTIRKILKSRVQPYVYYTPLQLLDEILTMNIRPITYQLDDNSQVRLLFHLNFMHTQVKPQNSNIHIVMDHTQKVEHGGYILAQSRMVYQYNNSRLPKSLQALGKNFYKAQIYQKTQNQRHQPSDQNMERPECFDYAHFHIPIYKNPVVSGAIIYLPLAILSVLNLSIFFSQSNLANRLTNIATLLIAFVQLIPIIREQIPPTPYLTVTEIIVVLESITAMLCLLSTIIIKFRGLMQLDQEEFAKVYNPWSDAWFLLALITTLLVIISPCIMFGYYFIYLRKSHQRKKRGAGLVDFQLFYNYNQQANQYFYKLFKSKSLLNADKQRFIFTFNDKQLIQRQKICDQAQKKFELDCKQQKKDKKTATITKKENISKSLIDSPQVKQKIGGQAKSIANLQEKQTQNKKQKKLDEKKSEKKQQDQQKVIKQAISPQQVIQIMIFDASGQKTNYKDVTNNQENNKQENSQKPKKNKKQDKWTENKKQMNKFNKKKIQKFHEQLKKLIEYANNNLKKDDPQIKRQL